MEALTAFIAGRKAKKAVLPRIPTDEVLPVFFFDDTPMLRNAIMCWTMRFNDVLDAEKLHHSLARLVSRDDGWRKLRGRIRLNFQEPHVLERQHMTGVRMLFWCLRYLLDIAWWPKMETRTVFLPRKAVKQMRADAIASLQASTDRGSNPSDAPTPFVSDGDVVAAWLSCMASKQLSSSSSRSVVIMTPIDARSRMPSVFPRAPG
ncbi:hypothetical protein PG987_007379 [Apiospora arundinis]